MHAWMHACMYGCMYVMYVCKKYMFNYKYVKYILNMCLICFICRIFYTYIHILFMFCLHFCLKQYLLVYI